MVVILCGWVSTLYELWPRISLITRMVVCAIEFGVAIESCALVFAPAARIITPAAHAGLMAGVAEIVAVTAQDEVEEVEARAAEMEVVPEVEAPPAAGDDLAKIKGLGPKLQALLPQIGLATYAQIAALDDAALDALDAKLGAFAGRPRRDSWVEQARFLASGDVTGFEGKFGKL